MSKSSTMRAMRAKSFTGYGGLKLVEVPRRIRAGARDQDLASLMVS
jgi:hypothetical protein